MRGELRAVVDLNEAIKAVAGVSARIHRQSLNAMLAARREGGQRNGFETVTRELRRFSDELDRRMAELASDVGVLVRRISELQRLYGNARLIARVPAPGRAGSASAVNELKDGNRREAVRLEQSIAALGERFHSELQRSVRFCGLGASLVVNAAVEGAGSERLTQVAAELQETVRQIEQLLRSACAYVNADSETLS